MSEFSVKRKSRIDGLVSLFHAILKKEDPVGAIRRSEDLINNMVPSDVIFVVDELVREAIPMDELKTGINKLLNVLHQSLKEHRVIIPEPGSFIECCIKNNDALDGKLKALRPAIKELNKSPEDLGIQRIVENSLEVLLQYEKYYIIKENILFPVLESHWPNFRCLGVMWSFHDDVRRDLRALIKMIQSEHLIINEFNRNIGNVYFNMYAIRFREEAILFPYAAETLPPGLLDALLPECMDIGFPYFQPDVRIPGSDLKKFPANDAGLVDLDTGLLHLDQIKLIFNHLPVDITFVDEDNKVRYFSTPGKRIFPRSKAVIGRDVHNCHPPESVHIVEEIIKAFRSGKESKASFWIQIKSETVLIQYFAIRDGSGDYKGVIEVSQEISQIKALEGEKRLLEW
jgi:PAS domain S-box-containing protein